MLFGGRGLLKFLKPNVKATDLLLQARRLRLQSRGEIQVGLAVLYGLGKYALTCKRQNGQNAAGKNNNCDGASSQGWHSAILYGAYQAGLALVCNVKDSTMALATEVKLPRTQQPKFPDRCVFSGEDEPDEMDQFKVDSLSWSSTHAARQDGSISVVDVPVKRDYKRRLQRQRKLGFALYGVYGIVGAVIAMNADDWLGRDLSRFQTILTVIVGLSPVIAFQIFAPPAFAVRASGNNIVYEFKSAEYAGEFEALNKV